MVINVDLRRRLRVFVRNIRAGTKLFVVNERGDYLLNPDPDREFGFEFGKPGRIQDDFPEFAKLLANDDTTPRVMMDRSDARLALAGNRYG